MQCAFIRLLIAHKNAKQVLKSCRNFSYNWKRSFLEMLLELFRSRAVSSNSSNNFFRAVTEKRKKMRRNLRRKRKLKKLRENENKKVSFAVFYKAKCYLLCRSVHKFFICNRRRVEAATWSDIKHNTNIIKQKLHNVLWILNSSCTQKLVPLLSSRLLYLLYCAIRTGRLFHDR